MSVEAAKFGIVRSSTSGVQHAFLSTGSRRCARGLARPASADSGSGSFPDVVWPCGAEELQDWTWAATTHALLDTVWPKDDVLHYTFNDAWISVAADFARGEVTVTSHLLDAFAPPVDTDPSAKMIVELASDAPQFAFRRDSYGVTASATVPARPFVPVHLSRAVLELVLFSEEFLARGEWDIREFQSTTYRAGYFAPLPFCGNPKMEIESQYSSCDGHPMWDREWEWDDEE